MSEPTPQPDAFDFFRRDTDAGPSFIWFNVTLAGRLPDPGRPYVVRVSVPLKLPNDQGLPTREERPHIDKVEGALESATRADLDATYAGRVLQAGELHCFYYVAALDGIDAAVSLAMADTNGYQATIHYRADADGSTYFRELAPSHREWQALENRHVIENLERHGDPLTEPREVTHWAYFATPADRDGFMRAAAKLGYATGEHQADRKGPAADRPYGAVLRRVDRVDWHAINAIVDELFLLAEEHHGEYDGWETQILKPDAAKTEQK